MNSFDIARKITHMPGIKLEATIDPTLISVRVKKAAQKMICSGILNGGYRSTSRLLAEQLLKDSKLVACASATKWGVVMYSAKLTHATKAQIKELILASRMIELATESSTVRQMYTSGRYDRTLKRLMTETENVQLSIYQKDIAQQIAELIAATRTPEQVNAAKELAYQLDGTQPIKINMMTYV